jgi:hypothetical protein
MFVIILSVLFIYLTLAKSGRTFTIKRKIPAIDMIPHAVGRATEQGKSIHGSTGGSSTTSTRGPHVLAGLTMMEHVAEFAGKNNIPFYQSPLDPDQIVLAQEALQTGYLKGGNPEAFHKEYVLFHGTSDGSFAAGVLGFLSRERPGANFLFGGFGGESILLAEEGNRIGAFQIAGTPTIAQLPFLVTTCDYLMMADELFVAGCIISGDQSDTSLIIAEDLLKLGLIVLAILGTVLITFNINWLKVILSY